MKPRWHLSWRILVVALDALFVTGALMAVAVARFGPDAIMAGFVPAPGRDFAQAPLLLAVPVWLGAFAAARLYSPQRCQNALEEGRRLITSGLGAALAMVMLGFVVKESPARSWLFGGMVLATVSAAVGRKTVRGIVGRLRERGRWMTPTVVVGRRQAKALVEAVLADPSSGIEPVAVCGFEWPGLPSWDLGEADAAARASHASGLLIVAQELERHEVGAAIEVADGLPVQVVVLPGLDHLMLGSLQLVSVLNEPGVALEPPSVRGFQALAKRAVDVLAGLMFVTLSAPMMAMAALAIRVDSKGPVLFRQRREGLRGRTFELLKFRTMVDCAPADEPESVTPDDLSFLTKPNGDPRVTRIGRLLRGTSLDELPQLWNVLRGDMSLVGPRPLPLWEAKRLGLHRRLVVRPGITGLWQVSGRSTLSPEERIRLDIVYVQNWSLLLDLSILLRTVPAVVGRRGAY